MRTTRNGLPPDLKNQNDNRAKLAQVALDAFQKKTKADEWDALPDLLCDLIHWCDRTDGTEFDEQLARARRYYAEETRPDDPPVSTKEQERMNLPSFQRFDAERMSKR